jgi:hypothetical protein
MRLGIGLFACAVVAALAILGCGGGSGAESNDPASLAPADAPIYVQAVLRPKGKLKTDTETLASTISGLDDPTGKLIELIDKALNEKPTASGKRLSFAKDIAPWLGRSAGLFVEDLGQEDPPAAAIVQSTGAEATRAFLDDSRRRSDKKRSYEGVDYLLDDGGTARGVVDDFLVVGSEKAFKDAVEVSNGGDSLGDQSDFQSTLDEAPSGSLADAYISLEGVTKAIRANDADGAKVFEAVVGDTSGKTLLASLVPASDHAEIDISTNAKPSFLSPGDLSDVIGGFPAGSFAAIGIPDLGSVVDRTIAQLDKAGVVSRETIEQGLSQVNLRLDDLTGALGDLGAFAEGTDRGSLQGAAVITGKDPAKTQNLIAKLRTIAGLAQLSNQRGIRPAPVGKGISISDPQELGPQPLIVTTEGGKIAIGYGKRATEQALSGGAPRLADDPTFKQALGALGATGLSGYVSLPKVFKLAESLGAASDPDYRAVRPYLDRLSYAVFGFGSKGDLLTGKVIIGVRH